jgi:large subunit ribosomal protein L29
MVVIVMKANEINKLNTAEITKKIDELKTELFNLRFQLATGQLENTARIKEVKKDIARMKTIIRERELNN